MSFTLLRVSGQWASTWGHLLPPTFTYLPKHLSILILPLRPYPSPFHQTPTPPLKLSISYSSAPLLRSRCRRVRYTLSKRSFCKLNLSRIAASYTGISCQDVALGFSSRKIIRNGEVAFRWLVAPGIKWTAP